VAEERGSSVYAAFIVEQLNRQDERKTSLEQRGISVVTSSGTFVSLLFALVAVLTGAEDFELPGDAQPWLLAAAAAFVVAGIGGILTNAPGRYRSAQAASLEELIDEGWSDAPEDAEGEVAAANVEVFKRAKVVNELKGRILVAAIAIELLAVVFLAIAIEVILAGS
jgi:hypothetical protein